MKYSLTFLNLCFGIFCCTAQAPVIEWQKSYGGGLGDIANDIRQTADGGYIIVGQTASNDHDVEDNHGFLDGWVVKISSSGALEWAKTMGGSENEGFNAVSIDTDGAYIIIGHSESHDGDLTVNYGKYDVWIVKLNPAGDMIWQKTIGGSSYDYANSVQTTNDGGIIAAGETASSDGQFSDTHGFRDGWLVKLNADGETEWSKCYGGAKSDGFKSVVQLPDGGYVVTGYASSNDGDLSGNYGYEDYWLLRLNALGSIIWQRNLGGSKADFANDVFATPAGEILVTGHVLSNDGNVLNNNGGKDYWTVKLNGNGNIIWKKNWGSTGIHDDDEGNSVYLDADGNVVVAGEYRKYWCGEMYFSEYGVVCYNNANGEMLWEKIMGGGRPDAASAIRSVSDGGLIVSGNSASESGDVTENFGSVDFWIVKLGAITATSDMEEAGFTISPNPARSGMMLHLNNTGSPDLLSIFDAGGKVIRIWAPPAGQAAIPLEVNGLSAGYYIFKMQFNGQILTCKFEKL